MAEGHWRGVLALGAGAVSVALLFCLAGPALAQDDDEPRRDPVMSTGGGNSKIGTNEQGDQVMQVRPTPKAKPEVPEIGPIYVMPQVNQGQTSGGVQPGVRPGFQPGVQPGVRPGSAPATRYDTSQGTQPGAQRGPQPATQPFPPAGQAPAPSGGQ